MKGHCIAIHANNDLHIQKKFVSGQTLGVLQTVLTQAITLALDLPESHAAKVLQDQINAAFRGFKPM